MRSANLNHLPEVIITISREKMYSDTRRALIQIASSTDMTFQQKFRFVFENEPGSDYGGLRR